ncbi:hypothetical protein P4O66_015358 [Electrophorus voltai]|uniref:Chromo domain-containing protein n=1 Tax=Electrophorus voltai TaxID=2609070 RepID=A0AAD8Z0S2_9TELE|nr:hypothetical protein P4O66_015358 [Electrophorus voltai]
MVRRTGLFCLPLLLRNNMPIRDGDQCCLIGLGSPCCAQWAPSYAPGSCMVDGVPAYMVKRLLDIRRVRGGVRYLVDLERYGLEKWSWVPSHHILDRDLIRAFRQDCVAGLGTSGAAPSRGCGVGVGGPVRVGARPRPPPATRGRPRVRHNTQQLG